MLILGSSAIHAVKYDARSLVLTIWFQHGARGYDYFGVPQWVYDGLINAPSKGTYFNAFIKNQYRVAG
ncbi:MAG: hypothetical protein ABT10_00205 [Novosphingobium sp. SCN 63-17]|nr:MULTISPECIES: KTSC domain-containing protein [unclassified Novosphingobium]MBN9143152.1 KTSC domain-containing protein [Novosphingobium sp.]MDR6706239.1 hypothetical protein [Novosphingobium sp. 1748]ODU84728.1 MAG: hypothetical protein ABT10_00205 [Novosphingobium sp. SCN 63-17]OJX89492.1 MAG: hypothetical protein BGP00_14865 [Novosphingobium sp. 63-713]